MDRTKALASRFREVIFNGTWVAYTNYKDQLTNLPWEMAVMKLHSLNSIAALTQHIHYYIQGVNKVFEDGTLDIKDQYSFDFRPIESQHEWDNILALFWKDAETFAMHIEKMQDYQLATDFVEAKFGTYQRNLDGMIEHCYYHLGQMVLLKKMLTRLP